MIELRSGLRLALEAPQSLRIRSKRLRKKLERDLAPQFPVVRLVHHALAEFFEDAIMQDSLKWKQIRFHYAPRRLARSREIASSRFSTS